MVGNEADVSKIDIVIKFVGEVCQHPQYSSSMMKYTKIDIVVVNLARALNRLKIWTHIDILVD